MLFLLIVCIAGRHVYLKTSSELLNAVQNLHSVHVCTDAELLAMMPARMQQKSRLVWTFAFSPQWLQLGVILSMLVVGSTYASQTPPGTKGIPADQLERAADVVNAKSLAVRDYNTTLKTCLLLENEDFAVYRIPRTLPSGSRF